jgi:hypothetical protein
MPRSRHDDYDDRDDREDRDRWGEERTRGRDREEGGGGGNTVLLIVGGVVLVVLLLCGGGIALVVFLTRATSSRMQAAMAEEEARRAAEQVAIERKAEEVMRQKQAAATTDSEKAKAFLEYWLIKVKANRLDEAYRVTTANFKDHLSRDQFEQFVQRNRAELALPPVWTGGGGPRPGVVTYLMGRGFDKGPPFWFTVVREGNDWKLDTIGIGGDWKNT